MRAKMLGAALVIASSALATDPAVLTRGEKEEAANCVACHSLRIVHSQRLSKAVWNREIDKMAGWGVKLADRDALIEYLLANFGEEKAPAAPTMTEDASDRNQALSK